jgi:beta-lactam-binding protein with PASTA domain
VSRHSGLVSPQQAQAGQALNAAGLVFGSVSYAVDYTCTNIGTVTWQSPVAGTRVNRGAAVSVRIATAPRPPRECLLASAPYR